MKLVQRRVDENRSLFEYALISNIICGIKYKDMISLISNIIEDYIGKLKYILDTISDAVPIGI